MFNSLISNFEMARIKGKIKDGAKKIEVFQDTVDNLVSMFINSLAINQSNEERIKEPLSLKINTKYNEAIELKEESLKLALEREENKRIAIENELATIKNQYGALVNDNK